MLAHARTHTHVIGQMHIHNGTMKSPAKPISTLTAPPHTLIPSTHPSAPTRCVFKHHKGDYTGAKMLCDQLIKAIFKARIYMSRERIGL